MTPRRALFVSNLFPSSTEPGRGRFNLDQLQALRDGGLDATVISPLPWVPGWRGRSTTSPLPPLREQVEGFDVVHPRAFYLPGWRGALNGRLYGWSVGSACREAAHRFAPDFVWTSFAFPDGVGVEPVARRLNLPFVVSVLGSDVNVSFAMPGRRYAMLRTFHRARVVFAKSAHMRDVMVGAGVAPDKICLDYNGVDGSVFHPRDRAAACRRLGVDPVARRLLFVGNLAPIKGPADLVHAIRLLALRGRAPELVMVGDGPLESRLRAEAEHGGIASRVRFAGRQPRDRVALWMAASDALVLPSHNEGVPNVVLEALASGRPVIATNVGGVREIHPGEAAGVLVPSRDPQLLATGIESVLARSWSEPRLAETVSEFTWHANARRVLQALDGVTAGIH